MPSKDNTAADLKAKGNAAFASKDYHAAIRFYSDAIVLDRSNHVLFSNRAASALALKNWQAALEDAKQTVSLNPNWPKGYSRYAQALRGMDQLTEGVSILGQGDHSLTSSLVMVYYLEGLVHNNLFGLLRAGGSIYIVGRNIYHRSTYSRNH